MEVLAAQRVPDLLVGGNWVKGLIMTGDGTGDKALFKAYRDKTEAKTHKLLTAHPSAGDHGH